MLLVGYYSTVCLRQPPQLTRRRVSQVSRYVENVVRGAYVGLRRLVHVFQFLQSTGVLPMDTMSGLQ